MKNQLLSTSIKEVKTGAWQANLLLSKWCDERNRIVSHIPNINTNRPKLNLTCNLI
jgi:hypothetical protein